MLSMWENIKSIIFFKCLEKKTVWSKNKADERQADKTHVEVKCRGTMSTELERTQTG